VKPPPNGQPHALFAGMVRIDLEYGQTVAPPAVGIGADNAKKKVMLFNTFGNSTEWAT
jgi:hypothetical protein